MEDVNNRSSFLFLVFVMFFLKDACCRRSFCRFYKSCSVCDRDLQIIMFCYVGYSLETIS